MMGGSPPARSGWWGGTQGTGTPRPGLDGGGIPGVSPTRQSSIANTCCAAGGMPLAFTQEDFLVLIHFGFCFNLKSHGKQKIILQHSF